MGLSGLAAPGTAGAKRLCLRSGFRQEGWGKAKKSRPRQCHLDCSDHHRRDSPVALVLVVGKPNHSSVITVNLDGRHVERAYGRFRLHNVKDLVRGLLLVGDRDGDLGLSSAPELVELAHDF